MIEYIVRLCEYHKVGATVIIITIYNLVLIVSHASVAEFKSNDPMMTVTIQGRKMSQFENRNFGPA